MKISDSDLNHILFNIKSLSPFLSGKKILMTGGTGFFGKWLLESIIKVNERFDTKTKVTVLTRDPSGFISRFPQFGDHQSITYLTDNVQDFRFPKEKFDYIIHAATDASSKLNEEQPLEMVDTIVNGTRRILEFARQSRIDRILYLSSGAVYGRQPPELPNLPEEFNGGPDPTHQSAAYGEAKRLAELLCSIYYIKFQVNTVIARCFAFVGPYLNLDIHFAIGNFIRDGLENRPLLIKGDGTPCRSYLYAADLVIWLLTVLFKGQPGRAYNVGSDYAVSIANLAGIVATCFNRPPEIHITKKQNPEIKPERYIPDIGRAKKELGLSCLIKLEEAIRRTIDFYLSANNCKKM